MAWAPAYLPEGSREKGGPSEAILARIPRERVSDRQGPAVQGMTSLRDPRRAFPKPHRFEFWNLLALFVFCSPTPRRGLNLGGGHPVSIAVKVLTLGPKHQRAQASWPRWWQTLSPRGGMSPRPPAMVPSGRAPQWHTSASTRAEAATSGQHRVQGQGCCR